MENNKILIGVGMMCGTVLACFAMYSAMIAKLIKPSNRLIEKSEKLFDVYLKQMGNDEFED